MGDGAHGGDEHGHVLGEAAGHDGVHGDGVDGGLAAAGRQDADDLQRVAGGAGEHRGDARLGRGDDGEAVGPAAVGELAADSHDVVGEGDGRAGAARAKLLGLDRLGQLHEGVAVAHAPFPSRAARRSAVASRAFSRTASGWMPPRGWGITM